MGYAEHSMIVRLHHFNRGMLNKCTIKMSGDIILSWTREVHRHKEEIRHISVALYQYMCRHIVGSEETVKTKRMLTTVKDNLWYDEYGATITSGSFGEGLQMKGSDLDYMYVLKFIKVYENKSDIEWDTSLTCFKINIDDTKLGFVKLQLQNTVKIDILPTLCVKAKDSLWLSNNLFKHFYGNVVFQHHTHLAEVHHGPCLFDRNGLFDFAFCLHSKPWISQADQWMTRSRGSWPSNDVISRVTQHGVLFVPIGVKGSPNEEIEWRISFSVGEKMLIYSFNHTQLLCYALLKIVLKDIISTDIRCKDLLCSYYLKNILFWVSEEMPLSDWKAKNLIHCFMQCLKRLLYCVEYSLCPHYFIPENNMFENKIEGQNRLVLLDTLYTLQNLSWRCFLFSPQLQDFLSVRFISTAESQSFANYFEQINSAIVSSFSDFGDEYDRAVQGVLYYTSVSIKLYHYFYLSVLCQTRAETLQLRQTDSNKELYRKYKTYESNLVQSLHCDAVSGWLKLVSFYYQMKQYGKVLAILAYSVSKCSQEMIYVNAKLSSAQHHLLSSMIFQTKCLIPVLRLLRLEKVHFKEYSALIPREIEVETLNRPHSIPPVVFAHFLSFICHYHLNDTREYRNSLVDLHLTISKEYLISSHLEKSASYNVLGVVLQIIGENDSAKEAFQYAIALDPRGICSYASQRLSMIN